MATAIAINVPGVGPTIPHATYLGGSDIGAVMGYSRFKTALDVWAAKTGLGPKRDSVQARSGNRFERVIMEWYQDDYWGGGELLYPGTIVHANGITGTTPDAIADQRNVQVKFVGYRMAPDWLDEDLGGEGIPAEVLAQVHWEWLHIRDVLGRCDPVIHVVAQIGTEPRVYAVEANEAFAENILEAGLRFWHDHIETKTPPNVMSRDDDLLRFLYARAKTKELDPMPDDVEALAREYVKYQRGAGLLDKERKRVGAELMSLIKDRLGYLKPGCKVTWREQKARVDWEAYAKELGGTDEGGELFRGDWAATPPVTTSRVIDVRIPKEEGSDDA